LRVRIEWWPVRPEGGFGACGFLEMEKVQTERRRFL